MGCFIRGFDILLATGMKSNLIQLNQEFPLRTEGSFEWKSTYRLLRIALVSEIQFSF